MYAQAYICLTKSKGASCNNKSGGSVQRTTRTSIELSIPRRHVGLVAWNLFELKVQ